MPIPGMNTHPRRPRKGWCPMDKENGCTEDCRNGCIKWRGPNERWRLA